MVFAVITIVMIVLFLAGMGYSIGNPDGEHVITGILAIVVVVAISLLIIWACFTQREAEIEYYNDGICTICGGEYEFSGATRYRSSSEYFYTCEDCGHTIQTSSIMK